MANRIERNLNVSCTMKGAERYILLWHDEQTREAIQQLGRWAANPELTFSWWDAATTCHRIRTRIEE
uniref:Uncharacterized protein n=1 Tax=viral metagenome TaxID=1070528 RepID=A0A6M3JN57_9ZZZZ